MPKKLPLSFYLQVLVCATLWGSAFPVIKLAYRTLPLTTYSEQLCFAGVRFILAGIMVRCFCRQNFTTSIRQSNKLLLLGVTLGQTYLQYICFYKGMAVSSGTLGSLLVSTGSLFWIILAPLLSNSPPPTAKHLLWLGVSVFGITLAVYAPGAGSGHVLFGCMLFMGATLGGTLGAICIKNMSPHTGSRAITSFSLFTGGVLLYLTGFSAWGSFWGQIEPMTVFITLYLAFLSACAFTLWNRLIEHYSVNVLSTYRFMIPLMAVIESVLFIPGETAGLGLIVGGSVLLIALFAVARLENNSEQK